MQLLGTQVISEIHLEEHDKFIELKQKIVNDAEQKVLKNHG